MRDDQTRAGREARQGLACRLQTLSLRLDTRRLAGSRRALPPIATRTLRDRPEDGRIDPEAGSCWRGFCTPRFGDRV